MEKAYIILGMKRSGHHAIAYWIAHNLNEQIVLHNDCCKGWGENKLIPNHLTKTNKQTQSIGEGKYLHDIFNIEDFNIDYLDKFDFRNFKNVSNHNKVFVMLVLRDPFNWIASSLKTGGGPSKYIHSRISLWKKQANLFLVPGLEKYSYVYRILYNDWFRFDAYKKSVSDSINIPTFQKGINITSPRGGGSSFDKLKFKDKAQEMKVLDRWEYFKDNPVYEALVNDSELIDLSTKIFGVNYGYSK